jgi:CheY-like chemotaxis protein
LRALEDRSRALDEARERAEAAVRAKDEFLAMLGHELRNPLSPILTALQLLRLKGQIGREHEIIERQVSNLVRLVDDLLDVSRLTTGKIGLRTELIEVSDVAARAIEMVSPMLERKRQVLSVEIPARGLIVEADPARLAQVFANLLTNAAKYSDDGTRIALQASGDHTHVRIRVTDEGIGISREMLDRVFDLFEQQRQAVDRSQGGLGLGLAIVRSLVTLHGGTVRASSPGEGQGAEFVVELPRAAAARAPVPHARTPHATVGAAGSARRVLVVDDNRDALTLLSDTLSAVGYQVQSAHDGPEALNVAAAFQPHVAVLDIGLPVMDGYELATRLRAMAGLGALRLIAVTGYGQESDQRRSGTAGFDAHLIKPVSLDELLRALSDLALETAHDATAATDDQSNGD